jgi:tRNA(fMet)-specific endonuclease VapC
VSVLVLDTDALTLIQHAGNSARFESLARMLDEAREDVYVTIISLDEQIHGAFNEIAQKDAKIRVRGYLRLHNLLDDYCGRPMLDYDEKAEAIYDRLKGMKGRPGTKDLRIAAIVLSHDATLVTGNTSDFQRIPMLKLLPVKA